MSRRQADLHARAVQRREADFRRAEQARERVRFYVNGEAARHHEAWTTAEYYDKATKDAEKLAENKRKQKNLEERRKKLEQMLFQEDLQYQQELKTVASKPKLFKNGTYLNTVATSDLLNINQGIRDKEEDLRRREEELRRYHAWRASEPTLKDAEVRIRSGALKSAWMEQIVEKEIQKKKEEEDTWKSLKEREEHLRRQIEIEQERVKEKERMMQDLKAGLESQLAELSKAETTVEVFRKQEQKEAFVLQQLKFINEERMKEYTQLSRERETALVNLALHKHRLRVRSKQTIREVQLDLDMLQRLWTALAEEYKESREKIENALRVLEVARSALLEQQELERKRQQLIDSLFDGEARQLNEKQDQLWAKEREARQSLMDEVIETLNKQVHERLEMNREQQRQNVLEREKILDNIEKYNKEVQEKEKEKQLSTSMNADITALQAELNALQLEAAKLEEAKAQEMAARAASAEEQLLRKEIGKAQREGANVRACRRKVAW